MPDIDETSKVLGELTTGVKTLIKEVDLIKRQGSENNEKQDAMNTNLVTFRIDHDMMVNRVGNLEKKNISIEKDLAKLRETKARIVWLWGLIIAGVGGLWFIFQVGMELLQWQ